MEHEKYSYVEALRWLAAKYNVPLEETEVSPEVKIQNQVAESLYAINNFAKKFFSESLFNTDEGRDIGLAYLKERGFRENIIQKFELGYNPQDRDKFAAEALTNQYELSLLQRSGLVAIRDEKPVDNYRGRIIFPIHNQSGKVTGFGARLIKNNDKAPKYINTPENEIYIKSKTLYGSWLARTAIDKANECLLVEGYTDVVSLHQAGIENVVASGGTSLTSDQLRLIKKYTNNLTIIYDGDSAGIKAALRGLDLALEEGLNVKLVLIPDNEDPDSFVNKQGAQNFINFINENKKDFILFQLDIALKEAGNDSNKKSILVNQIAETISKINKAEDFTKQQDYIRKSSELLKIDEAGLYTLVNKYVRDKIGREEKKAAFEPESFSSPLFADNDAALLLDQEELNERALMKCLLEYGQKPWDENKKACSFILESLEKEDLIDNKDLMKIASMYKNWENEGLEPGSKEFLYYDDNAISSLVVSLIQFPYEVSDKWKDYGMSVPTLNDTYKDEIESTINYLFLRKIKRLIAANQKDLENAKEMDDQMMLLQLHQHLKKMEMEITNKKGAVIFK
ncbi:MAG: DNA primase [Ginsengibacter sp.]